MAVLEDVEAAGAVAVAEARPFAAHVLQQRVDPARRRRRGPRPRARPVSIRSSPAFLVVSLVTRGTSSPGPPYTVAGGGPCTPLRAGGSFAALSRFASYRAFVPGPPTPSLAGPRSRSAPVARARRSSLRSYRELSPDPLTPSLAGPLDPRSAPVARFAALTRFTVSAATRPGPPYTVARGAPAIPAPLRWLVRCALSLRQ